MIENKLVKNLILGDAINMLGKDKILIIFFVVAVICLMGLTLRAEASISDYIANVKFYQSGDYAKLKFDAIQDFEIAWDKTSEGILFIFDKPTQIVVDYYSVDGWNANGGVILTKDELNNIPEGLYERWFYNGNTYDVYVASWGCGYNGCLDPDEFVVFQKEAGCDPDDFIRLKERVSGNTFTIYCAELEPLLSETPADTKHSNALKTDLAGLIALVIGLPAGLWVIYRIIKLVRSKRKADTNITK